VELISTMPAKTGNEDSPGLLEYLEVLLILLRILLVLTNTKRKLRN